MTNSLSVYKETANSLGYLQKYETHWKLWNMLTDLRGLDFGEVDAWENKRHPPTFKGCEPMIQGSNPVICD
jgi:hypothetical protein